MAVNQTITAIPPAGKRGVDVRETFVTKQEAFQDALVGTTVTQLNTYASELNSTEENINNKEASAAASAATATTAKDIAVGVANYQGDWVANYETVGYPLASSVSYVDGNRYISKTSNNLVEPTAGISTAEWLVILSVENLISITPAPTLNTYTLSINEYADPVTFTITNYDGINPASYTIAATLGTIVYTTGNTFTYEPPVVTANTADTISIYAVGEGQLRSDTVTVAVTVNDLGVVDGQSIIVTAFTSEFETNDLWEVI